jgi:hypothetical protein
LRWGTAEKQPRLGKSGQNGGVTSVWVFAIIFFVLVIGLLLFIVRR